MGFANDNASIKQHMIQIWNYLKGNESETILVFNLKVFLCAIMNDIHSWMLVKVNQEEEENNEEEGHKQKKKVNPNALGTFNEHSRY
jgi:hypothetical protein